MKYFLLKVEDDLHKQVRLLAAKRGKGTTETAIDCLRRGVDVGDLE